MDMRDSDKGDVKGDDGSCSDDGNSTGVGDGPKCQIYCGFRKQYYWQGQQLQPTACATTIAANSGSDGSVCIPLVGGDDVDNVV